MIDYSKLNKKAIKEGESPEWFTSGGYQLFMEKYSWQKESPKSRLKTIAKMLASHAPSVYPDWWETDPYTQGKTYEEVFFNTTWDQFISYSTPLLGNGGLRKRGTTVSCAGGLLDNNLFDRYNVMTEAAILTKHSHGTSYSIDNWPAEGEPLARGGRSAGIMPVIRDFINTMDEVVQGSRRGSLAYSLRPQHGDFDKVVEHLYKHPESNNVGWLIDDEFNTALNHKEQTALRKQAKMLGTKLPRGKGYFTFIDKMNRHLAEPFKRMGLKVQASNLCQETCLPSSDEYTFSCVILNYNLEVYRKWPAHLIHIGQIMSDCNISEYIETIKELSPQDQRAMAKILKFTEDFRALGSGVLGWHTLMQQERIVVGSLDSIILDQEIFSRLDADSKEATAWLADVLGEPEGCKGLGIRNATRLMMPPTKSTAEIMAGASEGIGLDLNMVFTKQSAGGEFHRINKVLLALMKERGVYNKKTINRIAKNRTVAKEDWMTEHEKKVFRNAFEVPMLDYLKICALRQPHIDQAQSINLYASSADKEEDISAWHEFAYNEENILSLYYIYSMRGASEVVRSTECESCQ